MRVPKLKRVLQVTKKITSTYLGINFRIHHSYDAADITTCPVWWTHETFTPSLDSDTINLQEFYKITFNATDVNFAIKFHYTNLCQYVLPGLSRDHPWLLLAIANLSKFLGFLLYTYWPTPGGGVNCDSSFSLTIRHLLSPSERVRTVRTGCFTVCRPMFRSLGNVELTCARNIL